MRPASGGTAGRTISSGAARPDRRNGSPLAKLGRVIDGAFSRRGSARSIRTRPAIPAAAGYNYCRRLFEWLALYRP